MTCLQIGAALSLRWRLAWKGSLGMQLLAVEIWFVAVPFQVFVFDVISILGGMLPVTVLAALATIWSPDAQASSRGG